MVKVRHTYIKYSVSVPIQDCAENKSKAERVWITKYLQDTMASIFVYLFTKCTQLSCRDLNFVE